MSDGDTIDWTPPPAKPTYPDYSNVKALARYFNRTGYRAWPAWLYAKDGSSVLCKDAEEAQEKYGIRRRESTDRERAQFGAGQWVWEWPDDCKWRPQPWGKLKFEPENPGTGKNYVPKPRDPQVAQDRLLAELIPTVTAAVVAALNGSGHAPAAPSHVDAAEWEEFKRFQEFRRQQSAGLHERQHAASGLPSLSELGGQQGGQQDEERAAWEAKAADAGVKIDRRWSLDRLRKEVLTELEKRVTEAGHTVGESGEAV
jgi:hypothetical protein